MKKSINKLISIAILKTEKLIGFEMLFHKRNLDCAKSSARYLAETVRYIDEISNFTPKNVFEIGANYGQDADFLKNEFGLNGKNVYVFEPHPELFSRIKEKYDFNCYELAISDKNEKSVFHATDLSKNNGISSLKVHRYNSKKYYKDVYVQSMRMDYFIFKNRIKSIDFLKIDVEGLTYEVLFGFGKRIRMVKAVQVETESLPIWNGQKTWNDVYRLLSANNFQLVDYRLQEDGTQADSFWIQKEFIKRRTFNLNSNKWKILS